MDNTLTERAKLAQELRHEASVNALCGAEGWTELLSGAADAITKLEKTAKELRAACLEIERLSRVGGFDPIKDAPEMPAEERALWLEIVRLNQETAWID